MRTRKQIVLIIITLFLFSVTACSSPEQDTPGDVEVTTEGEVTVVEEVATEEVEIEDACPAGGTLRTALAAPESLDPAFGATNTANQIATIWMDYFIRFDPTTLQLDAPNSLAEAVEVNDDGTEWTFTVRSDVQFHNGRTLTAEDIVFTYDRLRDPEIGAPTVKLYSNITGIEAVDDSTVVFTLENPNPDFLLDLSDWHSRVMDSEVNDYETEWNSTGAFLIESYSPEDRIVFTRNPNYWLEDKNGCSLPYLDRIELIFLSEDSARVEALRSAEIDYLVLLPVPYVSPLEEDSSVTVASVSTNQHNAINMRTDRGVGADNRVRQALKLATDRPEILDTALLGYGILGNDTPIGPAFGEYYLDENAKERDIEAAKALLADAGYADGLEIDIFTWDLASNVDLVTVWREQVAEAGVTVNINVLPSSVFYGDGTWLEADFTVVEWGMRPYPQLHLALAYECDAPWSSTHQCDEELDALIKSAASELDYDTRIKLYHDIQRILMDRGGSIIPFFKESFAAYRNVVVGVEPILSTQWFSLADVYITE